MERECASRLATQLMCAVRAKRVGLLIFDHNRDFSTIFLRLGAELISYGFNIVDINGEPIDENLYKAWAAPRLKQFLEKKYLINITMLL
jgi:hypothetical protein